MASHKHDHLLSVFSTLGRLPHDGPWNDWETMLLSTAYIVTDFIYAHLFDQHPQDNFVFMTHEFLGTLMPPENLELPEYAAPAVAIYALIYVERVLIASGGCHEGDKFRFFVGAFVIAWEEFCRISVPEDLWVRAFPVRAGRIFDFGELRRTVLGYLDLLPGGRFIHPQDATTFCMNLPTIIQTPLPMPLPTERKGRVFKDSHL